MSSPELNIELWEGVQQAHCSLILKCGGCPMGSLKLNIELRRVSNKLTVVEC